MKYTIKDIARDANVSITTVSLVLNNKPCRISQEKKDNIIRIAKENNYIANHLAQSLVTKKSKTIGLIIPDIENIFFSSLAKTVENICRQNDYSLILVNTNDILKNDLESINLLVNRGIDGLLLTISSEAFENSNIESIKNILNSINKPFVLLDRIIDDFNSFSVSFDNEYGGALAAKHLVENGHTKIGCISSPLNSDNAKKRLTGFLDTLKDFEIIIEEHLIFEGDYRYHSGYDAASKFINDDNDITAIFACNDMMAYGAIKKYKEIKKRIPNDISIIGYDNLPFSYLLDVNLTSIDQNVDVLAMEACNLLFKSINEEVIDNKNIILNPVLKDNGSVLNLNKQ